jgi:Domain of unknown function (DUF4360)
MKTNRDKKTINAILTVVALESVLLSSGAMASRRPIPVISGGVEISDQTILGGTNCAKDRDSLSILQSGQGQVISIQFNSLSIAGSGRASCILRTPISIPAGYKAIVSGGESNGTADLNGGDTLSLASSLMVLGNRTLVFQKQIQGPTYVDFGSYDSVFDSPQRLETRCADQDTRGLLGLNLAASSMSRNQSGFTYVTDVAIGVQIVPCR